MAVFRRSRIQPAQVGAGSRLFVFHIRPNLEKPDMAVPEAQFDVPWAAGSDSLSLSEPLLDCGGYPTELIQPTSSSRGVSKLVMALLTPPVSGRTV